MKIFVKIREGLAEIAIVIANEFKTIGTSYAILLVLIGGIFVYGILYNYMYEPNIVTDAPIAVVDKSGSQLSREYARLIDATPQVRVLTNNPDYPLAKELMKKNEVIGIIYIPDDFETRVSRGGESVFVMYGSTDAFLDYLAMQQSSTGAMLSLNARYRSEMLVFLPQSDLPQLTQPSTISVVGTALYNYTEGYGTYLIPAVLMVIIFQTLLMVIGMISGDERSNGSLARYAAKGSSWMQSIHLVVGKSVVYLLLYAVFSLFLLGLMPIVFQLPHIGRPLEIIALMIPYLLATGFFGLAASYFFTDSETPLLMIAFFSVGLIFLSGVSYPLELMPWWWRMSHFIVPAAPATLAFVKINSMGASMAEVQTEYLTLWIQCVVYFFLACLVYKIKMRAEFARKSSVS
ncbi:MAG: ABC transporter permease [Bacteroides sp.]